MQSALYVSLSAQVSIEKRLETIANNMANMKTAGFRADAVKFEAAMSRAATQPVAFSSPGDNFISRKPGSVTQTGNTLDVAVVGNTTENALGTPLAPANVDGICRPLRHGLHAGRPHADQRTPANCRPSPASRCWITAARRSSWIPMPDR